MHEPKKYIYRNELIYLKSIFQYKKIEIWNNFSLKIERFFTLWIVKFVICNF